MDPNDRFKLWFVPQGSLQWKEMRNSMVGNSIPSSIVSNIVGVGYDSIFYEWKRYTGNLEKFRTPEGFFTEWGRHYEPEAILHYKRETGTCGIQPGSIRHSILPWLWASCDQIIYDRDGVLSVLEIKCPQRIPVWYSEEGWKKISKYVIQVQMQMACTDLEKGYLYFWHPSDGYLELFIPRDEILIDHCVQCCEQFLQRVQTCLHYSETRNPYTSTTRRLLEETKTKILEGSFKPYTT